MAKEAYDKVPLLLSDGTEVTLIPLNIGRLKRFMKAFKEMDAAKDDELKGYDVFVTCTGIALEKELEGREELAEKFDKTRAPEGEGFITAEYREYLEDVLDMETIYKVLEVCASMKLNDPNLLRAVMEAQAGTS